MAESTVKFQEKPVPAELSGWLQSADDVLSSLRKRSKQRETVEVERIADLGLHWEDEGPDHNKSGFFARIGNRNMRLNDGAMKTLNRLMKGPQLSHWDKYQDRNAFAKAAQNILDNPDRRSDGGLTLRHDGLEVNCFLPSNYVIRDAHEMLADFLGMLNDNIGDIKGIQSDDITFGDFASYHVVMGNNLMPSTRDEHGQFLMFCLSMSETGQYDTRTSLGLYRMICTNSAIREQTLSQWNNRAGVGESKFYDATGEIIRMTGYLKNQFAAVFSELCKMKLEHEPVELLNLMKQAKVVSRDFWSAAKTYAEMPTEDGRPCTTQYDLFNAMTRGAKDLATLPARENAKQTALHLFTAPGGLYQELRSAMSRHRIRNDEENVAALN